MSTRRPVWLFVLPSALFVLSGLAYLLSTLWPLAFGMFGLAILWAVVGRMLWQKQEKS